MHVLTNAEKLIPLRDAASLAESRRLAGMRMVTGTTSPSTRYERISVSPASCSIKSEYVIASHAFKPQYKCINYIPTWEQRKLGEFSKKNTIKNANGALSETFTNSAEQGVISQLDYFDHDITNDANISGYYVVQPDDFVYNPRISTTAPCGPINRNRLNRAGVMSPLYTVFSVDASMDKTYLEHYFKTSRWHDFMFLEGNTGARSDRFSISDATFFEMPIWCPEISEQMAIAKQLETTDTLITLHQRKYDKLVVFKKSMLEKMFPKDGESVPEIRFAGFTDPWEQRKFVDFVEASGIRNKDNLQLESYSVSNDRGFVPQDEQFENGGTMRDADKTAYWIVEPGSFAYNPARINVGSIGYQSTRKNVIVSSLYEVFKTDRSCDDRFLWHWFKSSLFTKQIEMLQEGGVRLYFFFDKLQKSEIWMPNVDEQRIIGQQFDQLDSLITLHQRKRESRIIRVRSFIWLAGDISGIGVSAYQPEKRRPYDRRQHQRRNVVLRLLRAMDQRIQGRCNS